MIFIKLIVLFVVLRYLAKGFCEEEAKKRDVLEKELSEKKRLINDAYYLMKSEKKVLIATINELREDIKNLRWKLGKV